MRTQESITSEVERRFRAGLDTRMRPVYLAFEPLAREVLEDLVRAGEPTTALDWREIMERHAREHGWVKSRLWSWVSAEEYARRRAEEPGYRRDPARHRAARAKVSPERRLEIATMASRAALRARRGKEC